MLLVVFAIANMRYGIDRACADFPPPASAMLPQRWSEPVARLPVSGNDGAVSPQSQLERLPHPNTASAAAWDSVYASQRPARVAAPLLDAPIREPAWLPAVNYEPDVVLWSYYQDL